MFKNLLYNFVSKILWKHPYPVRIVKPYISVENKYATKLRT